MKESPIIFSTPMVQSILERRKTKTRRLNGLDKINENPEWYWLSKENYIDKKGRFCQKFFTAKGFSKIVICPYGNIGDLLWVRETWQKIEGDRIIYKAEPIIWGGKWKPSIYMPKSAARRWLKITDIRLERLHDISEEDAIKEGIRVPVSDDASVWFAIGKENSAIQFLPNKVFWGEIKPTQFELLKAFFAELWCDINGRDSWDANPWVWVITFEKYDR